MYVMAAGLVLVSGLIHAVWNLWTKQKGRPLVFLWACQVVGLVAFGPPAVIALAHGSRSFAGLLWLLVAAVVHGLNVLAIARTYSVGDLALGYPLMRGLAPLLVPVGGVLFLHEALAGPGWLGIALVVTGIAVVAGWLPNRPSTDDMRRPAVFWALTVGLAVTAYTLADKMALHYVSPVALNGVTMAANVVALTYPALRAGQVGKEWQAHWPYILLAGIASAGGFLLFLWALSLGPAAILAPMRAVGIVFGTVLGIVVLKERYGAQRVTGATMIMIGLVVLGLTR